MTEEKKIPFFLYIVVIIFIISCFYALLSLVLRLILIFNGNIYPGVYLSVIFLAVYAYFLILALYLMSKLRKDAIDYSIYAVIAGLVLLIWVNLLGIMIFVESQAGMQMIAENLFSFAINFIISIIVLVYLIKSKQIRKIFIKNE